MKRPSFRRWSPAIRVGGAQLCCRLGRAALVVLLVAGCGDTPSDGSVRDAAGSDSVVNDRTPELLLGPDTAVDQGGVVDASIGKDTAIEEAGAVDLRLGDEPRLDTPAVDVPLAIDAPDDRLADTPALDTSEAEAGGPSIPTCECGPAKLCCPLGTACMRWIAVFDNECIPCGGPSQPCCSNGPQPACFSPDLVCVDSYAPHSLSAYCRPAVADGGGNG